MRAVVVSVDYAGELEISLAQNAPHFEAIVVMTDRRDDATVEVARQFPNVTVYRTDVFYRNGAPFNKGAAVEQGLRYLGDGYEGWMAHFDADTVLPREIDWGFLEPGSLYTPFRRMLRDPSRYQEFQCCHTWSELPRHADREFAGYLQIFHTKDPVLSERPWYPTNWKHAGGSDSEFWQKWPRSRRVRPPFEVLHLGEDGKNWCGRTTRRIDGTVPENHDIHASLLNAMLMNRESAIGKHERFKDEKLP